MAPFGTRKCKDAMSCAQSCLTLTCVLGCTGQTSYAGSVALLAMQACVEEKCPAAMLDLTKLQSCLTGACIGTAAACLGS